MNWQRLGDLALVGIGTLAVIISPLYSRGCLAVRDAQRKIECEYYTVRLVEKPALDGHLEVGNEPVCGLPGSANSALMRNTRRTFEENCADCEHNNWPRS